MKLGLLRRTSETYQFHTDDRSVRHVVRREYKNGKVVWSGKGRSSILPEKVSELEAAYQKMREEWGGII